MELHYSNLRFHLFSLQSFENILVELLLLVKICNLYLSKAGISKPKEQS